MGSRGIDQVWIEHFDRNAESFACFVQFFSHRKPTTLNSTALVDSPVHTIALNMPTRKREWSLDYGHMLVELLSVCRTQEELEEGKAAKNEKLSLYGSRSLITVPMKVVVRFSAYLEGRYHIYLTKL